MNDTLFDVIYEIEKITMKQYAWLIDVVASGRS